MTHYRIDLSFSLVPVIGAMRGCVVPVVRSMLSKITPSDEQGIALKELAITVAMLTII